MNVSSVWWFLGVKQNHSAREKTERFGFPSPLLVLTAGTSRKTHFISLAAFVCFTLALSTPFTQRKPLLICKCCIFISQAGSACSAEEVSAPQKGVSEYRSSAKKGLSLTGALDGSSGDALQENNLTCLRTGFAKAGSGWLLQRCCCVLWEIRHFWSISGLWTFVQSRSARCRPTSVQMSRLQQHSELFSITEATVQMQKFCVFAHLEKSPIFIFLSRNPKPQQVNSEYLNELFKNL